MAGQRADTARRWQAAENLGPAFLPCRPPESSPASRALKARIIYNPSSGFIARQPDLLARVQAFIARHHPDVAIVPTARRHHATELARAAVADGCDLVVAFGGDGTMNEVAQALMGTAAVLGLVPCGSGNGLARHLGIPLRPEDALGLLQTGQPRLIDAGFADGHPFFVTAGIGFEAEMALRFNQLTRRGLPGYFRTGALGWWSYRPQDYVISHAGNRMTRHALTLTVANCNQYGNNARITPRASVDDGLLDLAAVPPVNLLNASPLLLRLFNGTLDRRADVLQLRGATFVVERPAPGPLHTDGESHEAGARVEFTVRPRCLRVLVPAA
jgi:YegS/Rv2252/BmrU family lipid kinase